MGGIFGHANYIMLGSLVFLAGFVDSIAGGGGLITLPAYLQFGLPLDRLLGTNKLSSSLGTTVAAFKFLKELDFKKAFLLLLVFFAALGAFLGAKTISLAPPSLTQRTPSAVDKPARRDSTVILSATIKPE